MAKYQATCAIPGNAARCAVQIMPVIGFFGKDTLLFLMELKSDDSIEHVHTSVQYCHTPISVYLGLEVDTYPFFRLSHLEAHSFRTNAFERCLRT